MKIAFIIREFQDNNIATGGVKVFYELVRKFLEHKHVVDIYCEKYSITQLTGINAVYTIDGCCNYKKPKLLEEFYTNLETALKGKEYDYIISNNITPACGNAFIQGHSAIYYKNTLRNPVDSLLFGLSRRRLIKRQKEYFKGDFKRVFVVSDRLKDDLISNFNIPENKISVIYSGVEIPNEIIPSDNKVFTFGLCAPSFKLKGGYIFLNALKILKDKGYKFKARIIYPKFKKHIAINTLLKLWNLNEYVEFISGEDGMQNFYNSIDCLSVPSFIETFSLVTLEALANKRICIVGSSSGVCDLLKKEYNDFIFKLDNRAAQNLAEKMAFVLDNSDKMDKYREIGFKIAQNYSWEKTYNDFVKELSGF